jgi:hypothetical protein
MAADQSANASAWHDAQRLPFLTSKLGSVGLTAPAEYAQAPSLFTPSHPNRPRSTGGIYQAPPMPMYWSPEGARQNGSTLSPSVTAIPRRTPSVGSVCGNPQVILGNMDSQPQPQPHPLPLPSPDGDLLQTQAFSGAPQKTLDLQTAPASMPLTVPEEWPRRTLPSPTEPGRPSSDMAAPVPARSPAANEPQAPGPASPAHAERSQVENSRTDHSTKTSDNPDTQSSTSKPKLNLQLPSWMYWRS